MTARPLSPEPRSAAAGSPHVPREEVPMSRSALLRSARRGATVAVSTAALSAAVAMPSPAMAGSMFFSKSSGRTVNVQWLEVGSLPAPIAGNIHFGEAFVEERSRGRAYAWGNVIDLTCPDGYIPERPGGGHGEPSPEHGPGEPPVDPNCTFEGMRFIDGGNLFLKMDRNLTTARLTGNLAVHGESGTSTPPVDATWTGVGSLSSGTDSGTYTDGYSTYSYRYSYTGRQAVMSGKMGPMVFDDEPGESSSGQMATYRSATRERIR